MAEKTGERRHEILQTVAQMLENPAGEKVTTAALAKRLGVSEAALYRHFKGKAEMYDGLIEFIEQTLFALINRITGEEKSGVRQVEGIISVLLGFAQKNRGMTRVLIGDVLVNEDERLQLRINQLHDRIESTLKQALRFGATQQEVDADADITAQANVLMSFVAGRWHQFAKSGFRRDPLEITEAAQHRFIRAELIGGLHPNRFAHAMRQGAVPVRHGRNDARNQIILYLENYFRAKAAAIRLCPQMRARTRVHQLRGHAQLRTGLAQAPLHHVTRAEFFANCAHI